MNYNLEKTNEFIEYSQYKFPKQLEYTNTKIISFNKPTTVSCKFHGEVTIEHPYRFMHVIDRHKGCPLCHMEMKNNKRKLIEEAKDKKKEKKRIKTFENYLRRETLKKQETILLERKQELEDLKKDNDIIIRMDGFKKEQILKQQQEEFDKQQELKRQEEISREIERQNRIRIQKEKIEENRLKKLEVEKIKKIKQEIKQQEYQIKQEIKQQQQENRKKQLILDSEKYTQEFKVLCEARFPNQLILDDIKPLTMPSSNTNPICPKHGMLKVNSASVFLQMKSDYGCKKCRIENEFKKRVIYKYGDAFTFESLNVDGDALNKPVTINCKFHGEILIEKPQSFSAIDNRHEYNFPLVTACPKCKEEAFDKFLIDKRTEYETHANATFNIEDYVNVITPIPLTCLTHNIIYMSKPDERLVKCPECQKEYARTREYTASSETIEKMKESAKKNRLSKAKEKCIEHNVEFVSFEHSTYYDSNGKLDTKKHRINYKCPKHGLLNRNYDAFRKTGCGTCASKNNNGGSIRLTKEQMIEKIEYFYGKDFFAYNKLKYVNGHTPIELGCFKHKIWFNIKPNSIPAKGNTSKKSKKLKYPCPECRKEHASYFDEEGTKQKILDKNPDFEFISFIHKDNKHKSKSVKVRCKKDGHIMERDISHLRKDNKYLLKCPICHDLPIQHNNTKGRYRDGLNERFLSYRLARKYVAMNDIYSYREYKLWHKITSPKFLPSNPHRIYKEFEHPTVGYDEFFFRDFEDNMSFGERKVKDALVANNIEYVFQKRYDDCRDFNPLPFDFFIPKLNALIEFDGKQHYVPIKFFGGDLYDVKFMQIKKRDKIKSNYCLNNNIPLLRIKYTHYNNGTIHEVVKDWLENFKKDI